MTNILKFQTKEVRLRESFFNKIVCKLECCRLEDGSCWYKIGTEDLKTKEIIWDEWRKTDE